MALWQCCQCHHKLQQNTIPLLQTGFWKSMLHYSQDGNSALNSQNQEGLPDPIIFLPSSLWSADCPLHHWAYLICQAQFNQRLFLCSSHLMHVVVFVSSTANNTRLQRNADSHCYNMMYQSCTKVINTLPQSQRAADNLNSIKIPSMLNSLPHLLGLYFTQGTMWGAAVLKSWNLHVLRLHEHNFVLFQPTASFFEKSFFSPPT